jgi:hypothetical protein
MFEIRGIPRARSPPLLYSILYMYQAASVLFLVVPFVVILPQAAIRRLRPGATGDPL